MTDLERPAGASLEGRVARVLKVGTNVAVALVAVGVVLMLVNGHSPMEAAPGLDPATLLADLASLRPAAFIWLGVLVVLATPAARVLTAGIGYLRKGEREMAVVGGLILAVIALGVLASTFTPQT
jgi:uncharacterized membrane protein